MPGRASSFAPRASRAPCSVTAVVEAVRNKGFRVTELSDDELDQMTQRRMLIEVPTDGEIAAMCDDELRPRVEELRVTAHELEELADRANLIAYLETDRRFHLGPARVVGQPACGPGGGQPTRSQPPLRTPGAGRPGRARELGTRARAPE